MLAAALFFVGAYLGMNDRNRLGVLLLIGAVGSAAGCIGAIAVGEHRFHSCAQARDRTHPPDPSQGAGYDRGSWSPICQDKRVFPNDDPGAS